MISLFHSDKQKAVTALAHKLKSEEQVNCPLEHLFTPGLYTRKIFIPAGIFIISEIHKTEHPFVISQGIVKVWTEELGTQWLYAPHHGVTKPGTRRCLLTVTDTIWLTFHVTNSRNVEEIKRQIILPWENLPKTKAEEIEETLCSM